MLVWEIQKFHNFYCFPINITLPCNFSFSLPTILASAQYYLCFNIQKKKKKKQDETLFLSYCKNYTCLELKIKKNYGKRKKSCLISASSGLWFWSRKCWPVMLWARSPQYLPTYNLQAGEFRDGISSFSCLQALVAELW